MDVKILKKQDNELIFLLKDSDPSFVNTLRRTILSDVPTLAIRTITFTKNTSALFDEVLAHRIGLIPFIADLKTYNFKDDCKCKGKGCGVCQVYFTLKAEGPITIHAEDIKCKDGNIKSVYGKIPVVQLLKSQELEFEALAGLGAGKEHTKFSPAHAYYTGVPKINFSSETKAKEAFKECDNLLKGSGKTFEVSDITKWNGRHEEICEELGGEIEYSEKDFVFFLETWGQLKSQEIISKALDIIDSKLDDFLTQLEKAD